MRQLERIAISGMVQVEVTEHDMAGGRKVRPYAMLLPRVEAELVSAERPI